ncbi:efflux RND transporter periplasmic adaptor subunit [Undibacterium fentianense]|uniref:Biotin/lipoyl-binding protein n=1 Tax=Undibacterium fentianense TaxID=2828728 RepID=A0A941E514_9BURK|nr:biotin/lipoyl-binding protein [Undibacterium fentianense]MBR7798908.1 biotin/lipoyl-binding protein [Undibacterium fentianense]
MDLQKKRSRQSFAYHAWGFAFAAMLTACSAENSDEIRPTERVQESTWHEELYAEGEIKAATSTPLNVPGEGWDHRQMLRLVPNGSVVKKGDVIAVFDAPESRVQLSQAEFDLLRKEISETAIVAQADLGGAELSSESARVETDLSISRQYANADLKIFAKNSVLDKLVDIGLLTDKQGYLAWKKGQLGLRQAADQAVVNSQKESIGLQLKQKRQNLASLELTAPHDGVFILKPRWDGSLPEVGARLWAGDDFGSLPNLDKQVAKFSIAEGAAYGLKEGQEVRMRLSGTGNELNLKVTKVGKTASTKSRDTPVKYLDFEVMIEDALVKQFDLRPGQAVSAKVNLVNRAKLISVPNIALMQDGNAYSVLVGQGTRFETRKVEIGMRGPVRTEIKSGLKVGDEVVLTPKNETDKNVGANQEASKTGGKQEGNSPIKKEGKA